MKNLIIALALSLASSAAIAADPLVTSDWLNASLDNDNLVILDVRSKIDGGSLDTYKQGHVPGAVYTNYLEDGWRTKDANGTPAQLPQFDQLEALFERLGIENSSHVVIVPAGKSALDMGSATRVYWTLKVAGHDDVSVLDGGFAGWTANPANPIEQEQALPFPSDYEIKPNLQLIARKQDVKAALGSSVTLIDNRPPEQFSGQKKHEAAARFGTIPGAINIPEKTLTRNGTGSFKDITDLAKLYQTNATTAERDEINFCNTGHWASLGWFVSHELVGNKKAKLYDGSMVEWTADKATPISTVTN